MVPRRRDRLNSLSSTGDVTFNRRNTVKLLGSGLGILAGGKAIDNVFIGYGSLTGTNLVEQPLAPLARDGFLVGDAHVATDEHRLFHRDETVRVETDDGTQSAQLHLGTATVAEARAIDEALGFEDSPIEQVVSDFNTVHRGEVTFAFSNTTDFFDRVASAEIRPYTVGFARGESEGARPEIIEEFTGADPGNPESVLTGLKAGFREHARYDSERYIAGSIQEHAILNTADLRQHFRGPVGFKEMIQSEDDVSMFCYEFTTCSVNALHAVGPIEQTPQLLGQRFGTSATTIRTPRLRVSSGKTAI